IVGDGSDVDVDWARYVASKGIPVIGGVSNDAPFLTNPDFFPSGSNQIAGIYGILKLAKKTGPKFAEVYCAEAPQCAETASEVKAMAPSLGVQVVDDIKVSSTAADYTAVCQAI